MKKVLCLLLSVLTCITLSISVFAEETKGAFTPDPSGIEPIISGPVERSIFGNDDRKVVSDENKSFVFGVLSNKNSISRIKK